MDEVTIHIDAAPEAVYDLIADVTQMGRWSPETHRCEWLGSATGPQVGARFKGWNRARFGPVPVRWSTVSTVRRADRGRAFSFDVAQSATRWTYRLDPHEGGTAVTESRESIGENLRNKVLDRLVPSRVDALLRGMGQTLERLKQAAEAASSGGSTHCGSAP
jgi:uncharacterized protein YndB with AHSA1/START domain